jgi:peptidoglycan/LPS O-acetylase OafA/YrhL
MTIASVPKQRGKFLENIQSLRAVATLLIVCSHWRMIDTKYSGDPLSLFNFMGFGRFAIDMFFVVSGFIMVYITWGEERPFRRRAQKSFKFIFSRTTRIYPIYWIISGALLLVYMVKPNWVFSSAGQPDFLSSFFLWPDNQLPFLNVAWTLVHEMGFYVIFAALLFIPQRKRLWALLAWGLLISLGLVMGWRSLGPVWNVLFSPFSFDFIVGALLAYLYCYKKTIPLKPFVLWGLFLLSFVWALTAYYLYQPFIYDSLERVLIYILPAILCVYAAIELNRQNKLLPKWMQTIGNWSFVLYLTHVLTLSAVGRIWAVFASPNTPIDNIIAFFISVAAAILVSAITYNLLELPLRNVTNEWRKKLFK